MVDSNGNRDFGVVADAIVTREKGRRAGCIGSRTLREESWNGRSRDTAKRACFVGVFRGVLTGLVGGNVGKLSWWWPKRLCGIYVCSGF